MSLAELSAAQNGVLARGQLARLGVTRHRIRSELRARRWRLVGPRVVVLHRGPLTREQRWWIAVLHAGPGSALAGLSAAAAGGLTGWDRPEVHVVVPKGRRVPPLPGVVLHESRRLGAADVHPALAPPRTRVARSLVDAAMRIPRAAHACALVAAGVQQRAVTPAQLREQLLASGRGRHRRVLLLVVGDIEGGSHSLAELDFYRLCRRHKLPAPRRQALRVGPDGRRRYLDADFDGFTAEIDGGVHLLPVVAWADDERQNELVIAGDRVLRFPSVACRVAEARVADQLRRAQARFGKG